MTIVTITSLPDKLYELFKDKEMTVVSGCYSNSFRATMLSKSEKFPTKFSYVAGQVTDKNGVPHEHGFLHAKNGTLDMYYDPTLERDKDRRFFIHEAFQIFSIEQLKQLVIAQEGAKKFEKMVNGETDWCQPRFKNGILIFEYAKSKKWWKFWA